MVDETGLILAGHKRVMAARHMGLKRVPCVTRDDLDDEAKLAIVVSDNQQTFASAWDEPALGSLMLDLQGAEFDLSLLGFEDDRIASLLAGGADPEPPGEFPAYDETLDTEHQCPKCGYKWSGASG